MSRLLSLRGIVNCDDNARTVDNLVFSYTSPDLTRAWKVVSFYLWPKDIRASTGTTEGQLQLSASLSTDIIGSVGFDDIANVTDNRQIGWVQVGFNLRDASVSDFITKPTGLEDNQALLDPQHIVNRNLYVNVTTISDSATSPSRDYNYLCILEEMSVTESEAILQMVKGVAQDIRN